MAAMSPVFPSAVSIPLTHPLSGKVYALTRADALEGTPDEVVDLIAACNESLIYEWLFRERLESRPYTEAQAAGFFDWMRFGWQSDAFFVFALLSPCGRPVGLLDIKSADPDAAEVGYWLSSRHRGLMGVALTALETLARDAGYRSLYARIRPGNGRSQAVMQRAGWVNTGLEAEGSHLRFVRQLVSA